MGLENNEKYLTIKPGLVLADSVAIYIFTVRKSHESDDVLKVFLFEWP